MEVETTHPRSVSFANTTSTAILVASIFGVTAVIADVVVTGRRTTMQQPPTTTGRVEAIAWRNVGGNGVDRTTMYTLLKPPTLVPLSLAITDGVGEV